MSEIGRSIRRRAIAAVVGGLAMALLLVGARLRPDADGYGTHVQLDLPACYFRQSTGYPCPTCGCTTAFSHATHGHLLTALHTQPFGALAALAVAMTAVVAGYVLVSGAAIKPWLRALGGRAVGWGIAAVFVVSWLYKIGQTVGVLP